MEDNELKYILHVYSCSHVDSHGIDFAYYYWKLCDLLHMVEAGDIIETANIFNLSCLLSNLGMVVSAGALQTTKQSSFSEQDTSKSSENVVTSEDASVSPGPSSTTQSEKTQNPFKTGCLITTSITSSFPYLKVSGLTPEQQEGLRIRLCGESKDIVRKFGNLHSRVYESLCEQNVPVDRLVAHLLSLSGFDPVYKDSQKPVLQSFNKELRSAGSIKVVLFIIRDYISFFNYRVIERIVEGLGTDQDKVELQNYEREFDEYSKRRVFERPPEYGSKSDSDRVDSIFVLDSVYERFTVKELKMFQYRLSKILNISPQSVVRFCGVGEVPFQLNLQVCITVQSHIIVYSTISSGTRKKTMHSE